MKVINMISAQIEVLVTGEKLSGDFTTDKAVVLNIIGNMQRAAKMYKRDIDLLPIKREGNVSTITCVFCDTQEPIARVVFEKHTVH